MMTNALFRLIVKAGHVRGAEYENSKHIGGEFTNGLLKHDKVLSLR